MTYTLHVFVTRRRGAPMEDLGNISVSPKPVRSEVVDFLYRGRPSTGMVALIDPHNWEKRPDVIPTIHVHMADDERSPKKALGIGLSKVAGKVFRIAHLGSLNELMILTALAGTEMAKPDAGIAVPLGSGVAAAQSHFLSSAPAIGASRAAA